MRRGLVAFGALTLVGLGLTGCGLFRFEQREPWRTQAEEACLSANQIQQSAYMSQSGKIDGPGACGMDYPFKISAFSSGSVRLTSRVTLACPLVPRIETWLDEVVKPASALYFGSPVVDIRAGSYSCRPRNNLSGAKLSEHAFGNAMDVMAFILADGREISVVKGWRGDPVEQDFLREAFVGACRYFTTVLAPGSDAYHYDHIHLDLARHDPRGDRRICKPILKFTPRLEPQVAQSAPVPANPASFDIAPIDREEEAAELPPSPGRQLQPSPAAARTLEAATEFSADLPGPGRPAPTPPAAPIRAPAIAGTPIPAPPAAARPLNAGPNSSFTTGHGIY